MDDRDEVLVTALQGDIDLANSREVGDRVAAGFGRAETVVLDCSGVTFMDCSGLRCLMELGILAAASGSMLILSAVPAPMTRLFQLAGLEDHFLVLGRPHALPDEPQASDPVPSGAVA